MAFVLTVTKVSARFSYFETLNCDCEKAILLLFACCCFLTDVITSFLRYQCFLFLCFFFLNKSLFFFLITFKILCLLFSSIMNVEQVSSTFVSICPGLPSKDEDETTKIEIFYLLSSYVVLLTV